MRRLVLPAFVRGWSFLFVKVAVAGMTPPTVAAARMASLNGWPRRRSPAMAGPPAAGR
jgi:hypothetical protein